MRYIFLYLLCSTSYQIHAQNWQQVGNFNTGSINHTYYDTLTDLMFISSQSRFNGVDTLDGFFTFDGSEFVSVGGGRDDCGNVGCGPASFLTRYQGDIYLSGPDLDNIDTVNVNGIARWDGQQWLAGLPGLYFGEDSQPYLDGYCIHDGKLYVSGQFLTADGDTCNSVACWDGVHWTGLNFPGAGFLGGEKPRVNYVFFYKDELYAAGNFYVYVDGQYIQDIVRYDGQHWHAVGGGLKGGEANIWDYAIYKDELYVCGYFRKIDGNVGNKIMRWDGIQWKEVGGGICSPSSVTQGLRVYNGKLLLCGIFNCVGNGLPVSNLAAWDGERWCSFGNSSFYNSVSNMFEYKGEFYVSGGFTTVDGQPLKYFARWIGDHATDTCSTLVSVAHEPEADKAELNLWPNPVADVLHLQIEGSVENIQVFNAIGQEMPNLASEVLDGAIKLKVRGLPAGLYSVTLRAGGRRWNGRFVKE